MRSRTGKDYAVECGKVLRQAEWPDVPFEPDEPVRIEVLFYRNVENKSWPKSKTRFARWDHHNFLKLLNDLVFSYLGIDDSQIVESYECKKEPPKGEKRRWVEYTIQTVDDNVWKK